MPRLKYNEAGHKRCYKCKVYRPTKNFTKFHKSSDGLDYSCIDCKRKNPLISTEDREANRLESFKQEQLDKYQAEPLVYAPIEKKVNMKLEPLTWDKLKTCRLVNRWVFPEKAGYDLWLENKRKNILHESLGY